MQWLLKVLKTPIGPKFINASKNYSTNSLPSVIPKNFKMRFKHVESFHIKNIFHSSYKIFWIVENSFTIIEKLNIINTRKRAKKFSPMTLALCIPPKCIN